MNRKLVQASFNETDWADVVEAAQKMGVTPATFLRIAALKLARGQE